MATYTTIQGEMWDQIAPKALGSTDYTGALMMKNRAYLSYFTFPAGIVLELPEITVAQSTKAPPWKQAAG